MHGASFGQAELPADDILNVHVNIHEFRRLLDEPPNTSTDLPFSATFMGWPLTPDDRETAPIPKGSASAEVCKTRKEDGSRPHLETAGAPENRKSPKVQSSLHDAMWLRWFPRPPANCFWTRT